jgi:cyclic pyranopterin phosphate synthase
MIADIDTIKDIAITTNGILLAKYAAGLKEAGLDRVNVSLDTLKPDRFRQITRCGNLEETLNGIKAAGAAGLNPVKINMVVMAGVNDDEIIDFARKTVTDAWNVRYIENMPVTNDAQEPSRFFSVNEMKKRIETLGSLEPFKMESGNGPAKYYKLPEAGGTIGFITPVTEHFCYQCNRLRLTADGKLRLCLLNEEEIDLREPLRAGASSAELKPSSRTLSPGNPRSITLLTATTARAGHFPR